MGTNRAEKEVEAEENGTGQVTASVTLEHVPEEEIPEGTEVEVKIGNIPEENTVVKEVAQWNMLRVVTSNAKVSKKVKEQVAGIEGSKVERVAVGQMALVDEAAAFLQG